MAMMCVKSSMAELSVSSRNFAVDRERSTKKMGKQTSRFTLEGSRYVYLYYLVKFPVTNANCLLHKREIWCNWAKNLLRWYVRAMFTSPWSMISGRHWTELDILIGWNRRVRCIAARWLVLMGTDFSRTKTCKSESSVIELSVGAKTDFWWQDLESCLIFFANV